MTKSKVWLADAKFDRPEPGSWLDVRARRVVDDLARDFAIEGPDPDTVYLPVAEMLRLRLAGMMNEFGADIEWAQDMFDTLTTVNGAPDLEIIIRPDLDEPFDATAWNSEFWRLHLEAKAQLDQGNEAPWRLRLLYVMGWKTAAGKDTGKPGIVTGRDEGQLNRRAMEGWKR